MKTKLILRTMGLFILMVSMFVLYSCSKKAQENLSEEQKQQQDNSMDALLIDEKDITETDKDLTTVDYKEFYDQLAPHGEWIQVSLEEIGMKAITDESKNSGNNSFHF